MGLRPETMSDAAKTKMAAAATAHVTNAQQRADTIDDILVRAWAVEQAVKSCGTEGIGWQIDQSESPSKVKAHPAVVPIARAIYEFVTEKLTSSQ